MTSEVVLTAEANQAILDAFRNLTTGTLRYDYDIDDHVIGDDDDDDDDDDSNYSNQGTSNDSLEEQQGRWCRQLVRHLQLQKESTDLKGPCPSDASPSSYSSPSTIPSESLRSIFRDCRVSDLLPIIVTLLQDRVDSQSLLPATQDVEANEEIFTAPSKSALSLTVPAMWSAYLYAHLLGRPGALGCGIVNLEALTTLSALVRRWTTECIGREKELAPYCYDRIGGSRNGASSTSSPSKSPPKKRNRRNRGSVDDASNGCDDSHDGGSWITQKVPSEDGRLSTLALGCFVALEVCKIPQQTEFSSWSTEAREAVLEGVLDALGTIAALFGEGKRRTSGDNAPPHDGGLIVSDLGADNWTTGDWILHEGRLALETCICNYEKEHCHFAALVILRGLLHLLQLQVVLPNGERGRTDAHNVARSTLSSLMERNVRLAQDAPPGKEDVSSQLQTPNRSKTSIRSSIGGSTTKALASSRQNRRVSLGVGSTPMTSPALKKNRRGSLVPPTTYDNGGVSATKNSRNDDARLRGVSAMFLGLLQKLVTGKGGLERAAFRRSTVHTVGTCLEWMPNPERAHFLRFLLKLCHSKISVHRLVACEVMGSVLCQVWLSDHRHDAVADQNVPDDDDDGHSSDGDDENIPSHQTPPSGKATKSKNFSRRKASASKLPAAILMALQGRLVDRIAAVRASALASLESAFSTGVVAATDASNGVSLDLCGDEVDETLEALLIALRRRVINDEAATVRKTAIVTLTKLLVARMDMISEFFISPICDQCQHPSLLVRRAAAESLTNLLEARCTSASARDKDDNGLFDNGDMEQLENAWSTCILPMVLDDDMCSKVLESFHQVVVIPLLNGDKSAAEKQNVAWRVLARVAVAGGQNGASKGALNPLRTALLRLSGDNHDLVSVQLLSRVVMVACQSLEDYENSSISTVVGSWCLLEALVCFGNNTNSMSRTLAKSKHFVESCSVAWETVLQKLLAGSKRSAWLINTFRSCLVVLSKVASLLTSSRAQSCKSKLQEALTQFTIPPEAITAAIGALIELTVREDASNARAKCKEWIGTLYLRCENEISEYLREVGIDCAQFAESSGYHYLKQLSRLVRALFSAGELAMIGFRLDGDDKPTEDRDLSDDPLYGLHVRPSKRMQELIQITVSDSLPGSSKVKTPHPIRAHGFLVLGKFCLRDEALAKSSLNLLARELHPGVSSTSPSVQNNALLVMGDLCVRYTNMTDRYMPIMAACLQSGATGSNNSIVNSNSESFAMVRKHAVLLLSSLLLQDYIKWRGLLFHRFLVSCSDEDEDVANLAESVLSGPLSQRNPKLFFNNFVESIFVLNNCTAHPIYISATRHGDGGSGIAVGFEGIDLDGETGQRRRRHMYDFLLSKLSDEEKIGVTARLAKDVFGAALGDDGLLSAACHGPPTQVDHTTSSRHLSNAWNVLLDTFYVLSNKAIKVGIKSQEDIIDTGMEDPTIYITNPSRQQVTVAKNRLLSKISRKHMIEIILPILCNLRTKLQATCSPLLKDLMAYLLDIFATCKTEVKEFLANDPTLLQEIEFDARHQAVI